MIPRYTPDFGIVSALQWLAGPEPDPNAARLALADALGWPSFYATPVESLRKGLYLLFAQFKKWGVRGRVLMSAQVCPVVPKLVEMAGYDTVFVDIDPAWPTPNAEQYGAMIDESVIAVIVSPLYGYLPEDWSPLLEKFGERSLILDLAQGLGLSIPAPLADRADVIGFSFGLGKGTDTGGGMLLTRTMLPIDDLALCGIGFPLIAGIQGTVLRMLVSAGAYPLLMRRMKDVDDNVLAQLDAEDIRLVPPRLYGLWQGRLGGLQAEFNIARSRAASLANRCEIVRFINHADIYLSATPTHLRQVLRLKDARKRDLIVSALRSAGVDCAPAGELLPTEYLPKIAGRFPNAMSFRADSIRLPFLGRLTEAEFEKFTGILEASFAQYLS